MKKKYNIIQHQSGFTLVELLIAMMVALLVSAAVFASYKVQQQTHKAQTQVTVIQQNLRAAMGMMSTEFRFAGFDPTYSGDYGLDIACSSARFQFTADLCENGGTPKTVAIPPAVNPCPNPGPYGGQDLDEMYQYQLFASPAADANDTTSLIRIANGQPIAENIEFIEFLYILDDSTVTLAPNATQLKLVRSVRVTIVGRADEPDFNYTNTDTYPIGSGGADYDPPDDNYRRRSLIKTIELRNMGII